jgi:hypothetical protein
MKIGAEKTIASVSAPAQLPGDRGQNQNSRQHEHTADKQYLDDRQTFRQPFDDGVLQGQYGHGHEYKQDRTCGMIGRPGP